MNFEILISLMLACLIAVTALTLLIARDGLRYSTSKPPILKLLRNTLTYFTAGFTILFILYHFSYFDRIVLLILSISLYSSILWWSFRKILWHATLAMSDKKTAVFLSILSISSYLGFKIYRQLYEVDLIVTLKYLLIAVASLIGFILLTEISHRFILRKLFRLSIKHEFHDEFLEDLDEAELEQINKASKRGSNQSE